MLGFALRFRIVPGEAAVGTLPAFCRPRFMCLRLSSAFASGNIATTSGYLHAKPKSSSGLHLDEGVFLR
jgi:hypothetical protein